MRTGLPFHEEELSSVNILEYFERRHCVEAEAADVLLHS